MPEAQKNCNAHAPHGLEIPKTLQERMLKFFLKAKAQRNNADKGKEPPESDEPQNPIEINDRSSGSE